MGNVTFSHSGRKNNKNYTTVFHFEPNLWVSSGSKFLLNSKYLAIFLSSCHGRTRQHKDKLFRNYSRQVDRRCRVSAGYKDTGGRRRVQPRAVILLQLICLRAHIISDSAADHNAANALGHKEAVYKRRLILGPYEHQHISPGK